eukprot:scaffold4054_cov142-Skeletonema_menzelii.AAC.13
MPIIFDLFRQRLQHTTYFSQLSWSCCDAKSKQNRADVWVMIGMNSTPARTSHASKLAGL